MPSPLTVPWSIGLDGVVLAEPSGPVTLVKVDGLGSQVDSHDTELDLMDGSVGGVDSLSPLKVAVQLDIECPGDPDAAGVLWRSLDSMFGAGSDRTLWIWLPSTGHVSVQGRCRGMTDDGQPTLPWGYIAVTCRFEGLAGVRVPV